VAGVLKAVAFGEGLLTKGGLVGLSWQGTLYGNVVRIGVGVAAGEVMEDGLWPRVESCRQELLAQLEDGVDDGLVDLVRTGTGAVGSRL
jgi:hypothetical protein